MSRTYLRPIAPLPPRIARGDAADALFVGSSGAADEKRRVGHGRGVGRGSKSEFASKDGTSQGSAAPEADAQEAAEEGLGVDEPATATAASVAAGAGRSSRSAATSGSAHGFLAPARTICPNVAHSGSGKRHAASRS